MKKANHLLVKVLIFLIISYLKNIHDNDFLLQIKRIFRIFLFGPPKYFEKIIFRSILMLETKFFLSLLCFCPKFKTIIHKIRLKNMSTKITFDW